MRHDSLIVAGSAVRPRLIEDAMTTKTLLWRITVVAVGVLLATSGNAQQTHPTPKASAKLAAKAPGVTFQPGLEPRAIEILKATSAYLAAAQSMTFTAVVSYESPSRLGPPLVYSTKSEITMQRPNKLKVITDGDGPVSEFYYDGKTMTAFSPAQKLVAIADAPPTIDAALQTAFDTAATYFPFTDVIVADPYKDIADGLKIAFYMGQSIVVGDTTTDMVAYVTGDVFVQAWIGKDDHLPRRIYAIYLNDPLRLRHVLELSNWAINPSIPSDAFVPDVAGAARIAFARPDAGAEPGMQPPPKAKHLNAQ
jgi:hypothetical protein